MPVIGVTGGVATGKSAFVDRFLQYYSANRFSADEYAKELVSTNEDVQSALIAEFGESVFLPDGNLNREAVRELVFRQLDKRLALEKILHPFIRKRWQALADECRASGANLVAEIPLLFETGADGEFDIAIVLACSRSQQIKRLTENRRLTNKTAGLILAAQMDLNLKIQKADHVIWNESSLQMLDTQSALLASHLTHFHE